ncbi:MAG: carboxypeptidase regulatory-like domain-containing protein [Bacteroidetes bacterium]|nr:carboxypeptidase regulatory-like domain-containing protein [Bacteroidota bacterium]
MIKYSILAFAIVFALQLKAQLPEEVQMELNKNGEVCFKFEAESSKAVATLTNIISIDKIEGTTVYAYANEKEFEKFMAYGIDYKVQPHPNENFNPIIATFEQIQNADAWDFYPTYDAYVSMMAQFETDYPTLCDIDTIGTSVLGRLLLVARISDSVGVEEAEPEFFYTSSIHGDELTGAILMLRLIDSLLTAYGTDPRITNLMNSMDIYINPMANPDGTYNGGNSTVSGAIRYNANGVDLNRNYPDRIGGLHPDGNPWQPETIAFMEFAEQREFVMSANFHGGAEVFNYPWDATYSLCADDAWWQYVGHEYADTAQAYSPSGYMNGFDDGITNGADWYIVFGGRQDLMNYYHQCREVTIEISDVKLIPASQLNAHWEYNRRSLLNYMEQATCGLRGMITDASSGLAVEDAEVYVLNHEEDSSWVYSSAQGNFHRFLAAGTYDIRFSAPCYETQVFTNVVVQDHQATTLNVQLQPTGVDFTASSTALEPGESIDFFETPCGSSTSWHWTFEGGLPSTSTQQNPSGITYSNPGTYNVKLVVTDGYGSDSITKADYIHVYQEILITDGTATTCNGLFYDSGGPTGSYVNNENHVLTIYPSTTGAKVQVAFTSFDVEYHSSCSYDFLLIYDGPDTGSTPIGMYCGSNSPGTITSTHDGGALTFLFHSDYSLVGTGWEAILSCETSAYELNVMAFLEGSFNGADMNTDLSGQPDFPMAQPFNAVPWNYSGSESVSTLPPSTVDWVLIELRDAPDANSATASTVVDRKAALMMSSGEIRDVDGLTLPVFDVPVSNALFVVIYHRNHLAVMSSSGLSIAGGTYSWDFTGGSGQAYGTDALVDLGGGHFGLFAGDANADGQVDALDKSDIWDSEAGASGYLSSDLNLDGESNNTDKNELWQKNAGTPKQVPD